MIDYFIALYDEKDNNIGEFNNFKDCAKFLNISCDYAYLLAYKGILYKGKYRIFKILNNDLEQ